MKTEKVVQQAHELAPVLAGEVLSLCTYTDLVLEWIFWQKCNDSDQWNHQSETWAFCQVFFQQDQFSTPVHQFT